MAEVDNASPLCQDAEDLEREAEAPASVGRSLRLGTILALGLATLATVAVLVRGGGQGHSAPSPEATPEELSQPSAVDSVVQLFQDQNRLSCPSCTCDCAWAHAPGVCDATADDGHCCWSCCCSGGLSNPHFGSSMDSSFNIYHNYDRLPAVGGDHSDGSVHVHHTVVHYHYYHHYNPGETAYVKGEDGKWEPVQIVKCTGDGHYEVRYLSDSMGGATSQIGVSNIRQESAQGVSMWAWAFIFFLLAAAGIYAYVFMPK